MYFETSQKKIKIFKLANKFIRESIMILTLKGIQVDHFMTFA